MSIHWLGLGLSSYPGFRAISERGHELTVWARDVAKCRATLEELRLAREPRVAHFEPVALGEALKPGDVVVSMLPASMHPVIAEICLVRGAHLVTSSYVSDALRAMDPAARDRGLVFLNEVGLDPGIDHLLAHELFARNREAAESVARERGALSFRFLSLCGGFPAEETPFRYRFSWSPLGVLRALRNPSIWIEGGARRESTFPFEAVREVTLAREGFEMYPNRDSTAYVSDYVGSFPGRIDSFIRGTLRPRGWSQAWSEIFARIPSATEQELAELSARLACEHSYTESERDRVVLHVSLEGIDGEGSRVFSDEIHLSRVGTGRYESAMASLVSLPVAIGIEEVLAEKLAPGVQGMPSDDASRARWMNGLRELDLLSV